MAFALPKSTFEPHPEGTFTGTIVEVRDMGEVDTRFGTKRRIAAIIENHDLMRDDGQPWQHFEFVNLASGKNARLTALRQKLFKRPLTKEELATFDHEGEMLNRQVRFQIEHQYGEDRTFANLVTWSLVEQEPPSVKAKGDNDPDHELPA